MYLEIKHQGGIVAGFISAITGIQEEVLKTASYDGGEIVKSNVKEKAKTSDVIVKLDDNNRIIVEMNGSYDRNIFNKNTGYAFSLINKSTNSNKRYSKVILINIDNFNIFNTKKCILHFKLRDEEGNIENDTYNSLHLILENVVNKQYNKNIDERIIAFARFLKMTTLTEMKESFEGSEGYMETIKIVEDLATNPDFIGYYDIEEKRKIDLEDAIETGLEQGLEKGIKQGIEQGIEQGAKQRNIEIAKNLISMGLSSNQIFEATGLSYEQIEQLKKEV